MSANDGVAGVQSGKPDGFQCANRSPDTRHGPSRRGAPTIFSPMIETPAKRPRRRIAYPPQSGVAACEAAPPAPQRERGEDDSLFERFAWLYAFFREHVFRDDTDGIAAALWPAGDPQPGSRLLELGCGPGFYACRFAERYRNLRVLGIDRSVEQLRHAERVARRRCLHNCQFQLADVLVLDQELTPGTVDALLSIRLFTVIRAEDRVAALAKMHRVLRPGGRCFIAEPTLGLRAAVPLRVMWAVARLSALCRSSRAHAFREPADAGVLTPDAFGALVLTQPWQGLWRWQDRHYQYALCEKAPAGIPPAQQPVKTMEDFAI